MKLHEALAKGEVVKRSSREQLIIGTLGLKPQLTVESALADDWVVVAPTALTWGAAMQALFSGQEVMYVDRERESNTGNTWIALYEGMPYFFTENGFRSAALSAAMWGQLMNTPARWVARGISK